MTNKKTVILRADGNAQTGMGHFTRSLALANMLSQNFNCVFATQMPSQFQISQINKVCKKTLALAANNNHFNQFVNTLTGSETVVLDNYYFNTDYQKQIKQKGCKLVCIDDLADKHFVADLVINHSEGVADKAYSKEPYTKLLLGFEYALLRKPFLQIAKKKTNRTNNNLLTATICFGGTDPFELVLKVCDQFLANPAILQINLISSADISPVNNPYKKTINKYSNLSGQQFAKLLSNSDIGFFPSSTMFIEACACRLPVVTGWFVNNQLPLYNTIISKNLGIGVNNIYNATPKQIYNAITQIAEPNNYINIVKNQINIIDGLSGNRITHEFLNL